MGGNQLALIPPSIVFGVNEKADFLALRPSRSLSRFRSRRGRSRREDFVKALCLMELRVRRGIFMIEAFRQRGSEETKRRQTVADRVGSDNRRPNEDFPSPDPEMDGLYSASLSCYAFVAIYVGRNINSMGRHHREPDHGLWRLRAVSYARQSA